MIATGGTIASSEGENGLAPVFGVEAFIEMIPEIKKMCKIEGKTIMNIDSSEMTVEMIKKIAETIYESYFDFDGFVVTHGTDTMSYTAAALTYMLQNIKKPVVITGSQKAIRAYASDAQKNIIDAIRFALEEVNGVFISFGGKIILGTRAKKIRTRSINAFESVNFPCAAIFESDKINISKEFQEIMSESLDKPFEFLGSLCTDIMAVKLFTGIKPDIFDHIKENYRGVIIESFGIGGIPSQENNILGKVDELIEAGVAVVITTQCLEEGIDLGIYQVGRKLSGKAIIRSGDMNFEATAAKLMWALANLKSNEDIKAFIETPFFGDIS
jgi:L-asparaginase